MSLEKYIPPEESTPQHSWRDAYRLYAAEHGADMPIGTLVLTVFALYVVLDNLAPFIGGWDDVFRAPAVIISVGMIVTTYLRIKRYR